MNRFIVLFPPLLFLSDLLFWHTTPGINVLLFSVVMIAVLLRRYPSALRRRPVQVTAGGALLSALMIFLHASHWALFSCILSLLMFSMFASEAGLVSFFHASLQALVSIFDFPLTFAHHREQFSKNNRYRGKTRFYALVVLLPLLTATGFYLIYLWGSPHFFALNASFLNVIQGFFRNFSFAHFFFIAACGVALIILLLRGYNRIRTDKGLPFDLRRKRLPYFGRKTALKEEALAGLVTLVLLNALLLVVNVTDVEKVWIHFVLPEHFSLKDFVHNGTWILSISILLSMIVTLRFFRGNLHFYSRNRWLKRLALAWLFQNAVLTFSVFLRNYHYMTWHGLAYGRIFVFFFLALVMTGLASIAWKIVRTKSSYFLLRLNSAVIYGAILFAALFNWDKVIVNYNLHAFNPAQIDVDFYLEAHEDVLPIVYNNLDVIRTQIEAHQKNPVHWISYHNIDEFTDHLEARRNSFLLKAEHGPWQSFTFADAEARKKMAEMK
ncbi:MAG TPA: DUF4173 domain-containing protein [Bacteroidia bacterium]|nr:DUF4173 domain-containing protein [Bacteroidia bacterium]